MCLISSCVALGQQGAGGSERPIFLQQLGHELEVSAGAFSPDGRFMLTGSYDGSTVLWELARALQIRRFEGLGPVKSVAFSSDGRLLAITTDVTTIVNVGTGAVLRKVNELTTPTVAQFSPGGEFLFVGGRDGAALLTVDTFRPLWKQTYSVTAAAFSSKGNLLIASGTGIGLIETASGNVLRSIAHETDIHSLGLSVDGHKLLLAGTPAVLIDTQTGTDIKRFDSLGTVSAVALSPDGNSALLAGKTIELWKSADPDQTSSMSTDLDIGHPYVLFSPDGQKALTATSSAIQVFDLKGQSEFQSFNNNAAIVWSVAASRDGRYVATGGDTVRIWDTSTGVVTNDLSIPSEWAHLVSFAPPDDKRILTAGVTAQLWDLQSAQVVRQYGTSPGGDIRAVSFSRDGAYIAIADEAVGEVAMKAGSPSYIAEVFDASTAKLIKTFGPYSKPITAVALSSKGEWLVTGSEDETVQIHSTMTNEPARKFAGARGWIHAVALSQDDRYIAAAAHNAYIWDRQTGVLLKELPHTSEVFSVAFSADDTLLLTGTAEKKAFIWNWKSGSEVRSLLGHSSYVVDAIFAKIANRETVLTASADNTVGFWGEDGNLLCKISSLPNGTWTVVDSIGRFDTNDPNQAGGLLWFDPKDPTRRYPVEAFFRDYFYPGLLSRSLTGEVLRSTRPIETLNTVQPDVLIVSAEQKDPGGPLTVVVEASDVAKTNGAGQEVHSGVYSIRLFRDGRVVGVNPVVTAAPDSDTHTLDNSDDLRNWRLQNAVKTDSNGRARVTFIVDVPKASDLDRTELTAYAFNSDRVHSATSLMSFVLKKPALTEKGTAYLINIGVSEYLDPKLLPLRFSSTDATDLQDVLGAKIAETHAYKEVVAISLVSPDRMSSATRKTALPTKDNIARVLGFLSGGVTQSADDVQQFGVVHRAGPQDLVFLFFSGRAETDQDGNLVIYPYDFRDQGLRTARMEITAAELSAWTQQIDAADMTIVLDACRSGAVEQSFRPRSIADSDLARLAYEKRVRILAGATSSGSAYESPSVKHSLLTYALLEGLRNEPNSSNKNTLDLGTILKYAADRVPVLSNDMQQPVLIDFSTLERSPQFEALKALKSEGSPIKIGVHLLGDCEEKDSTSYCVGGQKGTFEIENLSAQSVYVQVVCLESSGRILSVLNPRPAVGPGEKIRTLPLQFVAPYGADTYKIFASVEPIDMSIYDSSANGVTNAQNLRGYKAAVRLPFDLPRSDGGSTRSQNPQQSPPNEWTVVDYTIVVRRPI